ncbi:WG repeat-containing protein [Lactonifactor longoviformis]|uniref:WG repeat-containing protein n=1 Tax=Lactonifactor longoviformis TaxID=341220 RepID=UPI0036F21921
MGKLFFRDAGGREYQVRTMEMLVQFLDREGAEAGEYLTTEFAPWYSKLTQAQRTCRLNPDGQAGMEEIVERLRAEYPDRDGNRTILEQILTGEKAREVLQKDPERRKDLEQCVEQLTASFEIRDGREITLACTREQWLEAIKRDTKREPCYIILLNSGYSSYPWRDWETLCHKVIVFGGSPVLRLEERIQGRNWREREVVLLGDAVTDTSLVYEEIYDRRLGVPLHRVKKEGKYGYVDPWGMEVCACRYDGADAFTDELSCVRKDSLYGLIDRKGVEIVPCQYNWMGNFHEGFIHVRRNGKSGYINTSGEETVSCRYEEGGDFHEGLAWIVKNERWGYIDKKGQEVIPPRFVYAGNFCGERAWVREEASERIYNQIDPAGNTYLRAKQIEIYREKDGYASYDDEGMSLGVTFGEQWQYMHHPEEAGSFAVYDSGYQWKNQDGTAAQGAELWGPGISWEYSGFSLETMPEGPAKVYPVKAGEKWGIADRGGCMRICPVFDEVWTDCQNQWMGENPIFVRRGDKIGWVDLHGYLTVPCEYECACDESEVFPVWWFGGIHKFCRERTAGYLNRYGEVILPFTDGSYHWDSDLQAVKKVTADKSGSKHTEYWGIHGTRLQVSCCRDDADTPARFSEGYAVVHLYGNGRNRSILVDREKGAGRCLSAYYPHVEDFSEGMCAVQNENGLYGYIDSCGRERIPCRYEKAEDFSDGTALVCRDGELLYLDKTGKELPGLGNRWRTAKSFCEGLAAVQKEDGTKGYIDHWGNMTIILPENTEEWQSFHEGLAAVKVEGRYGYIDSRGRTAIPFHYGDNALGFSYGLAAVKDTAGRWGYIDTQGNVKIPFQYDEAWTFFAGLGRVRRDSSYFPAVNNLLKSQRAEGGYGVVNTEGTEILPCRYKRVRICKDGLAGVAEETARGLEKVLEYKYYNRTGTQIELRFAEEDPNRNVFLEFSEGLAPARGGWRDSKNRQWGFYMED